MPQSKPKQSKRHPDIPPIHPGEVLRVIVLPAIDRPAGEVAKALGITTKHLNDLVSERISLTPDLAIRLEAAFGRSAPAWLRLQESYDLWHARKAVDVSRIRRFTDAA